MAGETIKLFNDTHSATDRARIERVLDLVSEEMGFNPDYVSRTPGVKPDDYLDGNGQPYGWYYRSVDGHLYVQPVIWNAVDLVWENLGTPTVLKTTLDSRLSALESSILNKKYVQSDSDGIEGADRVTNMVSLTQTEYDAIATPDASTLYIIKEEV